jgi:hypothetical protein
MTWQQGGPAGITFQIAAVVMVVRERQGPHDAAAVRLLPGIVRISL